MNIKPIRGQIVVRPDPPAAPSALIVAPESVLSDNPNYFTETGVIVALAEHSYTEDGEDARPFDVQVGDRVHFNRYAGKQVTCMDDSTLYLVMIEKEIDCVIEGAHAILHGYQPAVDDDVKAYDRDPFADRL